MTDKEIDRLKKENHVLKQFINERGLQSERISCYG